MPLFWCQKLQLLILIQLLDPSRISQNIYAEALVAFKVSFGRPQQFIGRLGRYPCLRQRASASCYILSDPTVIPLFPGIYTLDLQDKTNSSPSISKRSPSHSSVHLHKKMFQSQEGNVAKVDDNSGVPTLTPSQDAHIKKPRNQKRAAIVGGVGAALLVIVITVVVYVCLMRVERFLRQASETESSLPSPPVEVEGENTSPIAGALSPYNIQNLRQLTVSELEQSTSNFSRNNIIGEGRFGLVYKGLLQDGSIVVIKRHVDPPSPHFSSEVKHVARAYHMNLVRLLGYSEDSNQQLLVYDYILNGNVGNHLYDNEGLPVGKLDMRQRLSIALSAAKGLGYLHSLTPPLLHMHFRTSNVLVDEKFIAKVSDYGLSRFITEGNLAGSSLVTDCFLDPELDLSRNYSERSDVYSFGVFLLEMISGHEAHRGNQTNSKENLVFQAKSSNSFDKFVDKTLGDTSLPAAKSMMKLALLCVDTNSKRPSMGNIIEGLERIQERETGHLRSEIKEEIGTVTLGSELFK